MKIPDGWIPVQLTDIADIFFSNVDKKIVDGEYPVQLCNYMDVYSNLYITNDIQFMLGSAKKREIEKFSLFEEDVIITKDSETPSDIAVAAVVAEDLHNTICGYHLAVIRPKKYKANGFFLMHLFHHSSVNNQFIRLANGVTRFGLTTDAVKHAKIPLPPLAEQRRIAEILSAWDDAIDAVTRLIAAKQRRKKALMQQLLTGKRRFPGFTEKWQTIRLGEVAEIVFSNVDKKIESDEIPVRLCNYLDVYNNLYLTNNLPYMYGSVKEREIKKFSLFKNDVIITKDSETPDDIANAAVVMEDLENTVCGYHLAIIKPNAPKMDGIFLMQLLHHPVVNNQFARLANGVTRFGLTTNAVINAKIPLPPIEEQRRIAAVLQTADAEIDALGRKLSALKRQKRGLMQKLLTGKVRVNPHQT